MNEKKIKALLESYRNGTSDADEILSALKKLPYENLGFANIDNHRQIRTGHPEVIFCQGKSVSHIVAISKKLYDSGATVLATRAEQNIYDSVKNEIPEIFYNETAKCFLAGKKHEIKSEDMIMVVTAGTADIPVAEEAAFTAEVFGNRVERTFDVGVAGIHRLFGNMEKINSASVIIVAAGMDGALPSVIGGLTDKPVIAVPTSVGYGASFRGIAALLTMLNSCAPGIGVVNIDNGFGAGFLASKINGKK